MSKKKQPKKKAGDTTKGYFEADKVVTMQEKEPVKQVTSTMLPKTDKKSYWQTPAGQKRIAEMKRIMKANKGRLVKA
jgi:hypothetical protein